MSKTRLFISAAIAILLVSFSAAAVRADFKASIEATKLYKDALTAFKSGHINLGKKLLEKAVVDYPDDFRAKEIKWQLAEIYKLTGENIKAANLIKDEIEKGLQSYEEYKYISFLAEIYIDLLRYRDASEILEKYLNSNSMHAEAARLLAKTYMLSGRKDEAWLLLGKFVTSGNKEAFADLLDYALKSGDIRSLMQILDERRLSMRTKDYLDFMFRCRVAMNHLDEAVKLIEENPSIDISPDYFLTFIEMLVAKNDNKRAIYYLDMFLKKDKYNQRALILMGNCFNAEGDKLAALTWWRKILGGAYSRSAERYVKYINVLIENNYPNEALDAFDEARIALMDETALAEEKAGVLSALGRDSEAYDEYLNVIQSGSYKQNIFDKLYADRKKFNLETKLKAILRKSDITSAEQALIELYLREKKISSVDSIIEVWQSSMGFFDTYLIASLEREAMITPENFHFFLLKSMIPFASERNLQYNLGRIALKMGSSNLALKQETYELATVIANSSSKGFVQSRFDLYADLAEVSLNDINDLTKAETFANALLRVGRQNNENDLYWFAGQAYMAEILFWRGDFDKAEKTLKELALTAEDEGRTNMRLDASAIEETLVLTDYLRAKLATVKQQYQEALNILNMLIETKGEGSRINDALELALFLTSNSTAKDLSSDKFATLNTRVQAKTLAMQGKHAEAADILKALLIKSEGLSPWLWANIGAEMLEFRLKSGSKDFIKETDLYLQKCQYPEQKADAEALKISYYQINGITDSRYKEQLLTFVNSFPDDLRTAAYKKIIENG